jgi:RHS repeat-associated protein
MIEAPQPGAEGTKHKLKYDAWNRLVKVTDNADATIAEYRYDGILRRITKLVPHGESNWDRTDYYYNESWQCLEERFAGNVSTENRDTPATAAKVQCVWDIRYIDAPVLRWRDTGGDPDLDETLYYCNDANMNVTALVNTSGQVVERYTYDPYGKATFRAPDWSEITWANSKQSEILYCGYRFDPETGLCHVRHRYYHPTLGWTQRDPGGYMEVLTLYLYVASRPCTFLDPSGLDAIERIVSDAVVLGGSTLYSPTMPDASSFMRKWWWGNGGTYELPQRMQDDLRREASHQRVESDLVAQGASWLRTNAEDTPCNGMIGTWEGFMFRSEEVSGGHAAQDFDPVMSWSGTYDLNAAFFGSVTKKCDGYSQLCCEYTATLNALFYIYNRYSWVQPSGQLKAYWGYLQQIGKAKAFFWTTAWWQSWAVSSSDCDYSKIESQIKAAFPPAPEPSLTPPGPMGTQSPFFQPVRLPSSPIYR